MPTPASPRASFREYELARVVKRASGSGELPNTLIGLTLQTENGAGPFELLSIMVP